MAQLKIVQLYLLLYVFDVLTAIPVDRLQDVQHDFSQGEGEF